MLKLSKEGFQLLVRDANRSEIVGKSRSKISASLANPWGTNLPLLHILAWLLEEYLLSTIGAIALPSQRHCKPPSSSNPFLGVQSQLFCMDFINLGLKPHLTHNVRHTSHG